MSGGNHEDAEAEGSLSSFIGCALSGGRHLPEQVSQHHKKEENYIGTMESVDGLASPAQGSLWDSNTGELLPYDGSARFLTPLDPTTADQLLERLSESIPWEQREVQLFGKKVPQPRLTAWFGDDATPYEYSGLRLEPNNWTDDLAELRQLVAERAQVPFNSALANLYRDGNDGVSWHSDDEPELGPEPAICSVSLGGTRRFSFKHKYSGETVTQDLAHGTVLLMSGATQRHWRHQIPKTTRRVGTRLNVTFRWIHAV